MDAYIRIKDASGRYHEIPRTRYVLTETLFSTIIAGATVYLAIEYIPAFQILKLFDAKENEHSYLKSFLPAWALGSFVGYSLTPESGPVLQEYLPSWLLPGEWSLKTLGVAT